MRERKPIDAALRSFLDAQAAAPGTPAPASNEELVSTRRALLVRALESRASIPGLPNKVETRDVTISGTLTGRVYTPPGGSETLPVLVYLHGGGWVAGSVATHDPFCRLLSVAAGVIIASVEYRLTPEHPHPAALDDAVAAVRWAANNAAQWGGDPSRLALGGDSAGGHLAAAAANRLCATAGPPSCGPCCCSTPPPTTPAQTISPTPTMRLVTGWKRTSCAGSGSNMRQALRRKIPMCHRFDYIRRPRFPQLWWQRQSMMCCATTASHTWRSSERRVLVSLTCTRRICITISLCTRRRWRGSRSLMPHLPVSPAGCGRRLLLPPSLLE